METHYSAAQQAAAVGRWREILMFALVGLLNTVIDFATLNLLIHFTHQHTGWALVLMDAISFSVAVVNSYLLNTYFTFRQQSSSRHQLIRFIGVSLIGLCVNALTVALIMPTLNTLFTSFQAVNVSKVCATALSLCWNYFAMRRWVYLRHSTVANQSGKRRAATPYRLQIALISMTSIGALMVIVMTILPAQFASQTAINGLAQGSRSHITGADWPGYLFDPQNTNFNTAEKTLSPANMAQLGLVGGYSTHASPSPKPFNDVIESSIVAVGNTFYFRSWNGYEYAVDTYTYQLRWKRFLGINTPPATQACYPPSAGVSSNELWDHGVLYVGGGDGALYALNAQTGNLLWKTPIATLPNEYLWGSPVIGNNHLYIGVSSFGDCPLIRGHVDMLDPVSGTVQAIHYTVGAKDVGNSLSVKAALVPRLNQIIYDTGNGPADSAESQGIVAVDWNTLANIPGGTWQVPVNEQGGDPDFGASCTIVPDVGGGQQGAVCHNKSAYVYAVQISSKGLKLKWSRKLGIGGDNPETGEGDIEAGSFDGHDIYFSTGHTTINNTPYQSAVYALDPTTGNVIWRTPLNDGFPLAALPGANGFLVLGLATAKNQGGIIVLATKDGAVLYNRALPAPVFAAPSIANGQIYVPSIDGNIYIFGLAPLSANDTFTGKTLGAQWLWVNQDVTHQHLTGTTLAIDAAGRYEVDNKNLLTQDVPIGDFVMTTKLSFTPTLLNEQAVITAYEGRGNYIKIGIINKGPQKDLFELTVFVKDQAVFTSQLPDEGTPGAPVFLQIVRLGTTFYGYVSSNNTNWLNLGGFSPPYTVGFVGLSAFYTVNGAFDTAQFYSCSVQAI